MVRQAGLADGIHKQLIVRNGEGKTAQVHRPKAGSQVRQRHQVLPVLADEYLVMMKRVLLARNTPLQLISGDGSGNGYAVVHPGFNFGPLFIVVPGDQLKGVELIP